MPDRTTLVNLSDTSQRGELCHRWNALWSTSTSRWPLSRFEQLELWQRTFAKDREIRAVVVERQGRWIAALPLVASRLRGVCPIWEVPYDDWSGASEMIVATEAVDDGAVYAELVTALRRLGRPLLRSALIAQESPLNHRLKQGFADAGLAVDAAPQHRVGVIDICGSTAPVDWESYQNGWSGNFRRQMRKMTRRAEELGGVELVVHQPTDPLAVASIVREGFAIEDRSWKGRDGTSVLRTPGMLDYFISQAELLAANGEFLALFLRHAGQWIAFEYGWSCRRVYYSPKVGFDESFAHLSPGQLLRLLWVERLFRERSHDAVDFAGPLADATSKWTTRSYPLERMIAATGGLGNLLVGAGRTAGRYRAQIREWSGKFKRRARVEPRGPNVAGLEPTPDR